MATALEMAFTHFSITVKDYTEWLFANGTEELNEYFLGLFEKDREDGVTELDKTFYKYAYLMFGYTPPVDMYRTWN